MKLCLSTLIVVISTYITLSYCEADTRYEFDATKHKKIPMSRYPTRYYVDKVTATCKKFNYRGAGGENFNNFASMEECQKEFEFDYASRLSVCTAESTPSSDLESDGTTDFNVCQKTPIERFYFKKATTPNAAACQRYNYKGCNEPKYSFPSEQGCKDTCIVTADNVIPNKVDCEVGAILTATSAEEREIKIVRDTEKSTCVHAIVDKATGTRGVFESFSQCQKKCHADAGASKRCASAPFQPTTVGQITTKYYYNYATKLCVQMMAIDREVDSSKNYFDTAAECISACPANNDDTNEENFPDVTTVCDQPKAAGNGNEESTLPRWYYDAEEKVCKRFTYSGVGGNTNNFETEALCNYICIEGVNGVKLPEETTTAAPAPTPEQTAPVEGTENAAGVDQSTPEGVSNPQPDVQDGSEAKQVEDSPEDEDHSVNNGQNDA